MTVKNKPKVDLMCIFDGYSLSSCHTVAHNNDFFGYFSIFSWLDFYVNSILDNKSFHRFIFSRTKNCQKSDEKICHVQGHLDA